MSTALVLVDGSTAITLTPGTSLGQELAWRVVSAVPSNRLLFSPLLAAVSRRLRSHFLPSGRDALTAWNRRNARQPSTTLPQSPMSSLGTA